MGQIRTSTRLYNIYNLKKNGKDLNKKSLHDYKQVTITNEKEKQKYFIHNSKG